MTEYEQLLEVYNEYRLVDDCYEELEELEKRRKELILPNERSVENASKQTNRNEKKTYKIWFLIFFLLSFAIFQLLILPKVFPLITSQAEWFSVYEEIPSFGEERNVYGYIFLLSFLLPFLFYKPKNPKTGGKAPRFILLFSIITFILGYLLVIGLDYLTEVGIFDHITSLSYTLNDYTDLYAIHLFFFGIVFFIISKIGFMIRNKRMSKLSKSNTRLNNFLSKSDNLDKNYHKEIKEIYAREEYLESKIYEVEIKMKKHKMFPVLNKEPAGFYKIMEYFGAGRIASVEEANYLYKIESNNEKIYEKQLDNIRNSVNEALKHHDYIRDQINSELDEITVDYKMRSFDHAVRMNEKEKLLDKIKSRNR